MERALLAIELMYSLRTVVPFWIAQSSLPPPEGTFRRLMKYAAEELIFRIMTAWRTGWTALLVGLGRQASILSPEIRGAALTNLQRILLGPQVISSPQLTNIPFIFDNVVFPMIDDVLSTELDERRGRREMSETRLRASTLLCKSFLQLVIGSVGVDQPLPPQFKEIWLIILDFMERLMTSGGKQDQLVR